ncbi:glycosyltransferase, partial [Candidatus Woesearchaeota archaeon]|nr:glycosyltransferase [Candidatus Woesearchaeota archaeon]
MVLVTVSIVSYNSPTLGACLETLSRVTKDIPHEVIVVDNNSKRHNPCDIQNNH